MRYIILVLVILFPLSAFAQPLNVICSVPVPCEYDTKLDGVLVTTALYKKAVSLGMVIKHQDLRRSDILPILAHRGDKNGKCQSDDIRYVRTRSWWMVNGILAKSRYRKGRLNGIPNIPNPMDVRVIDTIINNKPRRVFEFFEKDTTISK
jgi:hypothetical protein